MRKYLIFILCVFLFACQSENDSGTNKQYEYSCIIVNMGNYSESNGSICLYNANTGKIEQEVFTSANGRKIGAIIESVTLNKDLILLMCNNADKVMFVNSHTMKEVANPITNIGIPRYAAVKDKYAYVSCWDKKNTQTGTIAVSKHIAKIDLATKTVVGSLSVSGQPEGMLLNGDTLFVAAGYGLDVFDVSADTLIKHINSQFTQAESQQLLLDKNNELCLSLGSYLGGDNSGFMFIDATTLAIKKQLPESKLTFEGDMVLSPTKDKIYFLYNDGIVGGQSAEVPSSVYVLNVDDYTVASSPVLSGVGFYGLGVDSSSGNIYTANVNGFITNSMTYIYSETGTRLSSFMTGVGTCRFVFK